MRIPRFLGQRVNGNAWDFALGKLHGVGTADLVHVRHLVVGGKAILKVGNDKVGNDFWVRAASVRDLYCAMAGKLTTIFGEPA
jgi:hypothetical protein